MAGHAPYRELTKHWPESRRERNRKTARRELAKMELAELRKKLNVTQKELARRLKINQVSVSRLENSPNPTLGSIRRIVEALGGEVEVLAVFKDGTVELSHLGES